jgi:hypothetical protein
LVIVRPVHIDLWGTYVTTPEVSEKEAVIRIRHILKDAEGIPVPTAGNTIEFSVEGGSIAGTDNGDPTDPVSLKSPQRHLFNGKALVVVQSGKEARKITLTAKSTGLANETIVF